MSINRGFVSAVFLSLFWSANAFAEFVVLKRTAPIFSSETSDKPVIEPYPFGFRTLRFIKTVGARTAVQTVGTDDLNGCYRGPQFGENLKVDLWVNTSDLETVVSKTFRKEYDDGSSIEIKPGLVADPYVKSLHKIDVGETLIFKVKTAKRFTPEKPGIEAPAIDSAHDFRFANKEWSSFQLQATKQKKTKRGVRVTSETACVRLTGIAKSVSRGGGGSSSGSLKTSEFIPPKTALFWEDGTSAGTNTTKIHLGKPKTTVGKNECFEFGSEKILLCVRKSAIVATVEGFGGLQSGTVPKIKKGNVTIGPSMSKEVIQRVIRRHQKRVRMCYEHGLARDPNIEGKVTVGFSIEPTGQVSNAKIHATTLNRARVEQCVVKTVSRMKFPKPIGGGIVNVKYPFVFKSN